MTQTVIYLYYTVSFLSHLSLCDIHIILVIVYVRFHLHEEVIEMLRIIIIIIIVYFVINGYYYFCLFQDHTHTHLNNHICKGDFQLN